MKISLTPFLSHKHTVLYLEQVRVQVVHSVTQPDGKLREEFFMPCVVLHIDLALDLAIVNNDIAKHCARRRIVECPVVTNSVSGRRGTALLPSLRVSYSRAPLISTSNWYHLARSSSSRSYTAGTSHVDIRHQDSNCAKSRLTYLFAHPNPIALDSRTMSEKRCVQTTIGTKEHPIAMPTI